MSRRNSHPAPSVNADPNTQRTRNIAMGVVVAVVVFAGGCWWYTSPWRWLRHAEAVLPHDPSQADSLADAVLSFGAGNKPQAWLVRCRAQIALKKPLDALGAFSQITNPNQCNVGNWLAMIEEAQLANQTFLADVALSMALRLETERARILTLVLPLKANALAEPEVLELIRELRRVAGVRADCWRAVGAVEQVRNRYSESIEAYRNAVANSNVTQPIGLLSRREFSQLLINLGQFSNAEPFVIEVLSTPMAITDDQLRMAQLRRSSGDPKDAEKRLNEVLAKEPENLPARLLRGTILVELQKLAEAKAEFEFCLGLAPFHDEAHYRLSQTLLRQGDSIGASQHLTEHRRLSELKIQVVEINIKRNRTPSDPKLLDELADRLEALGQPNNASEWRRTAHMLRTLNPSSQYK